MPAGQHTVGGAGSAESATGTIDSVRTSEAASSSVAVGRGHLTCGLVVLGGVLGHHRGDDPSISELTRASARSPAAGAVSGATTAIASIPPDSSTASSG